MKLGIVIPLKAKSASRNWQATTTALHRTLRSVRQQSHPAFEAIVIGHDRPCFMDDFQSHVTFTSITTPPPTLKTASEFATDNRRFTLDKNSKILRGMQSLLERDISHWFTLDADDLLCVNFVETLVTDGCEHGAIIDGGYLIYPHLGRFIHCSELSQYCGSTSVLAAEQVGIPQEATSPDTVDCPWFRYPHTKMHSYFKEERNIPYTDFSDPIVGYVLGHGDNCSDGYRNGLFHRLSAKLKPWIKGKPISKTLAKRLAL
ncbi:glycosyltransferase family 2 protein [bacterium]|nr:glycosyltransferase family 2 protein [bacterium]